MWPRTEPALALALTALAAWLWGSYLNQLIDRRPYRHAAAPAARPPGPPPGVSWRRPARSFCFACGQPIAWYDNVPVFAWLRLGGRCRACGAAFGVRTLRVELATPCVLVAWHATWLAWGTRPATLVWGLAALSWLIVAAGLLTERRRWGVAMAAAGVALVALAAARLHW